MLMNDHETDAIVMIGEIGGSYEADAARWIKANGNKKPVVGFIAGQTAQLAVEWVMQVLFWVVMMIPLLLK
jgi:succinyl-CoA synthetase alpha subunit